MLVGNQVGQQNIAICCPGFGFSINFLESWTDLIVSALINGYKFTPSVKYSPIIYTSRNQVLGGWWKDGLHQKPFKGNVEYDWLLWIDSDAVFSWADITTLMGHDKSIVSGWCSTPGMKMSNVCEKMSEEHRKKEGKWELIGVSGMEKRQALFKAEFAGLHFMLVKKGVFEKLDYPWFSPDPRLEYNGVTTYDPEDVSFCQKAKAAGFDIWVDPKVRLGHEKTYVV